MQYSKLSSLAWPNVRDACGVGFIADIKGRKTHSILEQAITALRNLAHRGAVSADGLTGDGAGILTQLPHKLFLRELAQNNIKLENETDLAVGVFFIENTAAADKFIELIDAEIGHSSLYHLMWREIPLNASVLGSEAFSRLPIMRQLFVKRPDGANDDEFERALYLNRKRIEHRLREANIGRFYIPSFSSKKIVYKGLMVAQQLERFYPDLADPDYLTSLAVFHQRYSTNTMPRWSLSQPFRYLGHNGEINTLSGNVNFMQAREHVLKSKIWEDDIEELLPIIEPDGSDSAALDNTLELLVMSGRDPIHALLMLVPEAFEGKVGIDKELKGFYDYHATLMEPWDGPAALALSDGRFALAALDRNGLRPQRYWISRDGIVVVGSEAGVVNMPMHEVIEKGRLGPGMMLAVDTLKQELLFDSEIKKRYSRKNPYGRWIKDCFVKPQKPKPELADNLELKELLSLQKSFGYSSEDFSRIFEPMMYEAKIPVGSMGDDTPLAVLSEQPQLLYRYFKQRFAQVTNPPIDPLREAIVMSLETDVGPRGSILEEDERSATIMHFKSPLIFANEFKWLCEQGHFKVAKLSILCSLADGEDGLEHALANLVKKATEAAVAGAGIIVLSDRGINKDLLAIPMLLATSAVHHRLLEIGRRTKTAIVLETAEPREDHHFACLIGYGAALIYPYLAFETVAYLAQNTKKQEEIELSIALNNYKKAIEKGLLKIMSKMGISALSSYRAAKIFEVVGLDEELIEQYFTDTPVHLGGTNLKTIARDAISLHSAGFKTADKVTDYGIYRFRKAGEYHAFNPQVFKSLHKAVRNESFKDFIDYSKHADNRKATSIRDLLAYKTATRAIPIEEVEPVESIVKRFSTQAMSHGSVSRETHETLAIAMNKMAAKSNSGEGGEDPARFKRYTEDHPEYSHSDWYPKTGDWANSAIKQIASGRFGVTPEYLISARELEIKMAQGAKPGEGGQLPGHKVSEEIARIRHSIPGVTLISPPPHHDIYSIEDLAQLIYDLKRVNKDARVGVKLVATSGVGTIAAGVVKGYADNIQISGFDGGTGAASLSSIKNAGIPWEIGLAETQQTLVENALRGRVSLRVDGGLKTARDVIIAALLGAEEFGFGTAALVAAGCAMIRQCHLNTCPVGVATQNPELRKKYLGKPEHVINFMHYLAEEIRNILAQMGFKRLNDIIGRVELLEPKQSKLPKKVRLDFSKILANPDPGGHNARHSEQYRNERPEIVRPLDEAIYLDALYSIETLKPHTKEYAISNRERSVGARISGEIARLHSAIGLPANTISLRFFGVAGQSFGLFNNRGVHLFLEGEAQDYVGKGMYGGEIAIKPRKYSALRKINNTIVGNTVLYGATGGSLYAAGSAGERLAVRNSGAKAVVEGCGDHGCEYMTGGVVMVLGKTGRNFGAGMSGGIAYIFDAVSSFKKLYNPDMVEIARVKGGLDEKLIYIMLSRHYKLTDSPKAKKILDNWTDNKTNFWRLAPKPSLNTTDDGENYQMQELALNSIGLESGQMN